MIDEPTQESQTPTPETPATPTPVSTLTGSEPTPAVTPAVETPTPNSEQAPALEEPKPNDPVAADPWKDLDEDTRKFVGDKTPAQLATELRSAQALIGKKTIGIPGKDSTPEEQKAFHVARGVPPAADGYQLADVIEEIEKEFPGLPRDEAREKLFREQALASNLSNSEARELAGRMLRAEIAQNADAIKAVNEGNKRAAALVTEGWGAQSEAKTNNANRMARHIGLDDATLDVFLNAKGVTPEARFKFVDSLAQLGELLGEGGGPGGDGGLGGGLAGMTPDQARIAGNQYLDQGDNREAYNNPAHPRHKAVETEYTKYARVAQGRK